MDPTPIRTTRSARSTRTPPARRLAGLACLSVVLLAGCSSDSGQEEAASAQAPAATDGDVPLTALASTTAYALYVGAQASDDRRAPMLLGTLPAPMSDSDAPITLP